MIRILFVDDDMNLPEAMRLRMCPMRDAWSMELVSSGEEALDTLAKCPADVVISDMRMPRMDGWQLLAEVKELYPQTARLVLSGQADPGAIMQLTAASRHQNGTIGRARVGARLLNPCSGECRRGSWRR
jgi:DNA-binding NarL/FixJ family response regulator